MGLLEGDKIEKEVRLLENNEGKAEMEDDEGQRYVWDAGNSVYLVFHGLSKENVEMTVVDVPFRDWEAIEVTDVRRIR